MADDTNIDEALDEGGSLLVKLLALLAMVGLASFLLKRKREQELDEALWEEPRAL